MTLTLVRQNPKFEGGAPPAQVSGWLNCATCATAMLIAFETANVKRPTGGDVRACTVNPNGTPDKTGGTKPSQNVDAARRCFSVDLDYDKLDFEEAWKLGQRPDVALSVSISYRPVSGTQFDGSPGFVGLHQVVLHEGEVYDPLADGRRPGIPNGPQRWPKSLLKEAAGRYAGIGKAACVVGIAPVAKPKRYSVTFTAGAIWVYPADGSPRYQDGFKKATSAPCSAPFTIAHGKGRKRVVTVTAGRLKGQRVEPGVVHISLVEHK